MKTMTIPFVDLKAQYRSLQAQIDTAIADVIRETAFIEGKYLHEFEQHFADFVEAKYCIGVANGTDALSVALRSLGIVPGDEVITAANSYIATAEAIVSTGASVVFVDCDEKSYNIDASKIEQAITNKTKVIMPVHLYGQPADMDRILNIANRYELAIVEDAAQAHGARYNGRKVGTFGVCAGFSFYPGKNLGAYGDAGAVVTSSEECARYMRMYGNHGGIQKYEHKILATNSRLDGLQAAILDVKLRHLDQWNVRRREVAAMYTQGLQDVCVTPTVLPEVEPVYHLYVIQVNKQRDEVRDRLAERGIFCGVHYPTPIPYLEAFSDLRHTPEDFPVAYACKDKILSLPMHADLTDEQIQYVIDNVRELV